MNALLTKEFLCIKKQVKLLPLGLAVAFLGILPSLTAHEDNKPVTALSLFIALAAMLSIVFSVNFMSYEEKTKWDMFVKTLPLSSRTIVGAKYVLSLIFTAAGILLSFRGRSVPPARTDRRGCPNHDMAAV
jgi:ABC-type transport system involved in multi-copper enzyme maturation permease subunit